MFKRSSWMLSAAIILLLAISLAACGTVTPTPIIITATAPPTVTTVPMTITVEIAPSWTPLPPTVTPEDPTPTAEFLCTPLSTDHRCFLDQVVNPNAFFDPPPLRISPNLTHYTIAHPDGTTERVDKNVEVPGPPNSYSWDWSTMTGNFKGIEIVGWIPSIQYRYAEQVYAANITAAKGDLLFKYEGFQAQQGQMYLAKLTYRLDLFSRSGKVYAEARQDWIEYCVLQTDGGAPRYFTPPQGLNEARTEWTDKNTIEEVLLTFEAQRAAAVIVSCGIRLNWPAWEGEILFASFEVIPINWDSAMTVIR